MKTLRLFLFLASIAIWTSCGERKASDESTEIEAPGVGMAPDSANQKLDSTMKAPDSTARRP